MLLKCYFISVFIALTLMGYSMNFFFSFLPFPPFYFYFLFLLLKYNWENYS